MRNSSRLFGALFIAIALFGCVSSPPVLTPTKNLVEKSLSAKQNLLPQQITDFLQDTNSSKTIVFQGHTIAKGKSYTSALGNSCQEVQVSKADSIMFRRILCFDAEQRSWHLVRALNQVKSSQQFLAEFGE